MGEQLQSSSRKVRITCGVAGVNMGIDTGKVRSGPEKIVLGIEIRFKISDEFVNFPSSFNSSHLT